ncbi:hypothetical protein AB0D32_09420 [Micromonospora sp. NPDC048170]|uniref:hypothetical protein n=1 Tax=Micromonospora sp. NPDC048170 TaxID=3154819 RepID=UPI0033DB0B98
MKRMIVTTPGGPMDGTPGPCPEVTVPIDVLSSGSLREATGKAFQLALAHGTAVTIAGRTADAWLFCADPKCEHVNGPVRVLPDAVLVEWKAHGRRLPQGATEIRAAGRRGVVIGMPERVWSR